MNTGTRPHLLRTVGAAVLTVGLIGAWHTCCARSESTLANLRLPSGQLWRVSVADTSVSRARGLSGEPTIRYRGLLMKFSYPGVHGIWMKDMRFALDLVWLDPNGRVLAVLTGVPPCEGDDTCPTYAPAADARAIYVLEVASHSAASGGIVVGAAVTITFYSDPSWPP